MNQEKYRDAFEKFSEFVWDEYLYPLLGRKDVDEDKKEKMVADMKLKIAHTARVAWLMKRLAERMGCNERDTYLAFIIGLFHDLGRFEEIRVQGEFNNLTFNHGAASNKILYTDRLVERFNLPEEWNMIIKKAVFYHNKKDLGKDLDSIEEFFAALIRDVDKIDILEIRLHRGGRLLYGQKEPSEIIMKSYEDGKTIDLKDKKSQSDSVLLYLSFIKDLFFDESYQEAIDRGLPDKLKGIIDIKEGFEESFERVFDMIFERKKEIDRKKTKN